MRKLRHKHRTKKIPDIELFNEDQFVIKVQYRYINRKHKKAAIVI
jgi:hypothetical protein